jgi:Na+/phosphate symporter
MTTTLDQVNGLYEIAEYMEDEELTQALEFIAKVILKPDIPIQVATIELVRLQAIAAKMALRATWLTNVDKGHREKKNIYYTAAEQIDKVCSSLKYLTKG